MLINEQKDDWKFALIAGGVLFFTGIGIPISLILIGYGLGLKAGRTKAENGEYETENKD